MKHRGTAAVLAVVLTLIIALGYNPGTAFAEPSETETVQSSFEYKKYPDIERYLQDLMIRMNGVYRSFSANMVRSKVIPIPGLVSTHVMHGDSIIESEEYVPQGLCRAGKYMLVTAYDVTKKSNSVIYVVDMKTNRLVSTLALPNKYHAGGIAFDGENIWMTGATSDKYEGQPFVQYMTYDTFLRLIGEPLNQVTRNDISDFIYIRNKPSYLECNNGVLWVGTYIGRKGTSEGYMYGYSIVGDPGEPKLNTMMYSVITGVDSSAQGADIEGNYLYVSSSYNGWIRGLKTSFITKYYLGTAVKQGMDINVASREVKRVEVPKMNEEILVDGSIIHINFESGAEHWSRAVINTDRILAVKSSLWRGSHEE